MPQVQTRFLILSDTHAHAPKPNAYNAFPYRWPLPRADVAIHTGDLTMNGKILEHEQAVSLLKNLPADLKIVIPGNHDLTLDTTYYAETGELHGPRPKYTGAQLQRIRDMYTGVEAQKANIVYLEEGTRTLHLKNGARLTIYASAYTPEFCNWAFAYPRDQDRFNETAEGVNSGVTSYHDHDFDGTRDANNIDVMLTHGPPMGILDRVERRPGKGEEDVHVGCEHLLRAVSRARPLLHCFGHIHEGWGAVQNVWNEKEVETAKGAPSPLPPTFKDLITNCSPISVDYQKMVEGMGVFVDSTKLQRGKTTLFVNSSIMDVHYDPVQGPWVVDLMLDGATY